MSRDDWRADAACKADDVDPAWFFVDVGDTIGVTYARAVCNRCPVRTECLEQALADVEMHGVWGGTTPKERRRIRAARARRASRGAA